MRRLQAAVICASVLAGIPAAILRAADVLYALPVTVTSELPYPRVPMDPRIDFTEVINRAALPGVLDPNSVRVVDLAIGAAVPHALNGFTFSDAGTVEWVITDPRHTRYEIRFRTAEVRPPLEPPLHVPLIGVGDLLRYNAGAGRPFCATRCMSGFTDITGDGRRDLLGIWSYAQRPGVPWHCTVMWPRVGSTDELKFGDMVQIPSLPVQRYSAADAADLNGDLLPDVVHGKLVLGTGRSEFQVYLNTGRTLTGGLAVFEKALDLPKPQAQWLSNRIVDLDGDGALDMVLVDDNYYGGRPKNFWLRNTNPERWPLELTETHALDIVGYKTTFLDLDRDRRPDAVCLVHKPKPRGLNDYYVAWRRNLGGVPPTFGPAQPLEEIDAVVWRPGDLLTVTGDPWQGLLVVYENKIKTAAFESVDAGGPRLEFRCRGHLESDSAVMSVGDQAHPSIADWEGDGDWDMIIGGGYGWPRVIINDGDYMQPRFSEPKLIESEGEPIRLIREEVLGAKGHGHNMGYAYPVYADWDGDGLPDLMLPNETNRILWYRNIGTRAEPRFGVQQQLLCDGYPDSPEMRAQSAGRAAVKGSKHGCYPPEPERPFPWRVGAGFADFTGDGLVDMVTTFAIGTPCATLFIRYKDETGQLRLKKGPTLKTTDGDTFTASRYAPVDWDKDGDIDILCTTATVQRIDTFHLARNVSKGDEYVFEYAPLRCFGEKLYITRHGPKADAADIDGDGLPDVIATTEWTVFPFYAHAALMMDRRPAYTLGDVREVE